MSDDEIPEPVVLPCGCRCECAIVDGERTMFWRPCSEGESCRWLRYALAESRVQGNRIEHRARP